MKLIIKLYKTSYSNISKECWKQLTCYFIHTLSTGFCFYISIYLVTNLHFSVFLSGALISAYGIGTTLGGIISGKLCDQHGCQPVLINSLLLKSSAFFCLLFFKTPISLLPILFILGFTSYAFITANNTYILCISDQSESSRLNIINIFYIASNLGLGTSVLLMTLLLKDINYIFMLSSLLLAVLALFYYRQPNYKNSLKINTPNSTSATEFKCTKNKQYIVYGTLLSVFLVGLIVSQWRITYVAYMHTAYKNIDTHITELTLALNPTIVVLFQNALLNSLKNQNKPLIMGLGGFMIGFGMLLLSFGSSIWMAITACVVYTIGEMIFFAMAQLINYQSSTTDRKGQATGWLKSIYALSTIIGPSAGGFIFHHSNPNIIWYSSGFIAIIVMTISLVIYHALLSNRYQYNHVKTDHPLQT